MLNGSKRWIGNATFSDITVIWAKSEEDGQVKGFMVPTDTPGYAMVQEAQSVYIYRQDRPADADWCVQAFDLHEDSGELLRNLGQGEYVLKIGARSEAHVQHIRSEWEAQLTDTDEGMAVAED